MTRLLAVAIAVTLAVAVCCLRRHDTPSLAVRAVQPATASVSTRVVGPFDVAGVSRSPLRVRHPRRPALNWKALAACESSGHWHERGSTYSGGVQMDRDFWATYGGLRFAARPDLASRAVQIRVALNGWRARGSEPWPQCGFLLGGTR